MENSKQYPHPEGEADKEIRCRCFSPLPSEEEVAKRQERVLSIFVLTVISVFGLFGCETANYAPVVTAPRKIEATKLERGRQLFVGRCIECHTLPAIWKYSRDDWPKIVNDMSHRASLKPAERDAVIAYILAVRLRE